MANDTDPRLLAYDAELHTVTEAQRKADPEFWYAYKKANMKAGTQKPATQSPAKIHPKLAAYVEKLDAVSEKHMKQHPGLIFSFTGAKITPLNEAIKPQSIEHVTEIVRSA